MLDWYCDDGYFLATPSPNITYGVIKVNEDWGAFLCDENEGGKAGYLSSQNVIECGFGLASAIGLKPSCAYSSRQEAETVCENHYLSTQSEMSSLQSGNS